MSDVTPRHKLGHHFNPMVRAHGLDPEGRTCQGCARRESGRGGQLGHYVSTCALRSFTPSGLNSPRHRATWDACSLFQPRSK